MGQAGKSKRTTADDPTRVKDSPNWPLFVLALIGMALSGYLTYSAWAEKLVAGCTVGSACDVVLTSRWSTLFGIPTSLWGFLTYGLLAAVAWNRALDLQWKYAWTISLFGFLFSLYLTTVSLFALEATCPYCLTSLGLMTLIFAMLTLRKPAELKNFLWGPWLMKTGGGALVGLLVLHLYYAGYWGKAPGPEDPWIRGLAQHLSETDAKFYGAYWCPHCQDQKALFGSSAKRIPYVECSPSGRRGAVAPICQEKDIKSYPTWIIAGQRYTGVQSLDTLAQYSKFQPEGGSP